MPITLILLAAMFMSGCSDGQDRPKTDSGQGGKHAPMAIPPFDADTAFRYLTTQVGFGPRVSGTAGHDRCRDYLVGEMGRYADAVNMQPFSIRGYDGEDLKYTNIISSFNLAATTRILLLAHYDTRPWADEETDSTLHKTPVPGANDGASGIAVLLEIARQMKTAPPSVGVDILFTDGEDYGIHNDPAGFLHGSRYFASHLRVGYRPAFGILLDMVGDAELEIQKEQYSLEFAPDVVDLVWSAAGALGVTQFSDRIQGRVTDDHLPLNRAGIPTIDLIDFDYPDVTNRFWHTLQDTPDKCSPASLEAVGRVILKVLYEYPAR